jgi:hypothetical protein
MASNRVPRREARTPRHSPVQWSLTAKTAAFPSSERHVFGPRFAGICSSVFASALWRWTVARASRHARQTRRMP